MVGARPLVGFGWGTFRTKSIDYFRQANYPLTAVGLGVHNVYLAYASTLGLVGAGIWALAVILAIIGALRATGPPDLRIWRFGFLCYATYFLFVSSFVPPQVFPNLMFWLWAGVVWSGRVPKTAGPEPQAVTVPGPGEDDPGGSPSDAARPRELLPA
jgi:O-antigen ligase